MSWKNMFNLQKFSPVSYFGEDFNDTTGKYLLYVGDEMGYVRVFELSELFEKAELKPVDPSYRDSRKYPSKIEDVEVRSG